MLDLQINGFTTENFRCNFWEAPDAENITALNGYLHKEGVNQYLATLITASYSSIETNLQCIQSYITKHGNSQIIGVHMEGGLISRMGVHPVEHATALQYKEAKELLSKFPKLIRLWTLCPKLDPRGDVTRLLQDHDVIVSYGHSNASYQEAYEAFQNYDVRLVTHWGNAMYVMEDFHQRDCRDSDLSRLDTESPEKAGIGLAAYHHPEVYCMAIAGSQADEDLHLDPRLLKKLFDKKAGKMILVSDMVCSKLVNGQRSTVNGSLIGGLASLRKHAQNAINAGIPEADVTKACEETARTMLDLT
jgi:N-acetylglucosamine-6-phosphate deacetylase